MSACPRRRDLKRTGDSTSQMTHTVPQGKPLLERVPPRREPCLTRCSCLQEMGSGGHGPGVGPARVLCLQPGGKRGDAQKLCRGEPPPTSPPPHPPPQVAEKARSGRWELLDGCRSPPPKGSERQEVSCRTKLVSWAPANLIGLQMHPTPQLSTWYSFWASGGWNYLLGLETRSGNLNPHPSQSHCGQLLWGLP